MHTRKLGELEVSAIGLGCMSMSQAYGKPDPQEAERALHRALDVGYTFLDTASVYGLGHNEKLVGRVLKELKEDLELKDIPVLMVSIVENKPLALDVGAMDSLSKPIAWDRLIDLTRNAVRKDS